MKRNLNPNQILKAVLMFTLVASILPLEVKSQSTTTFSEPQNTMYYEHDGTNWVHINNIIKTYNTAGSRLTAITQDASTNQNLRKRESHYDSYERDTMYIDYKWQNNNWAITSGSKTLYQYNSAGKITQLIFRHLQNGVWVNSTKTENTYDTNGKIIEEIIYQKNGNNGWSTTNKKRSIFTYVNGELTEKLTFNYSSSGSTWVPSQKRIYAGWHNANLPMAYVEQIAGSNGVWNNWFRNSFTPKINGGYFQYTEKYTNGNWTPDSRRTQELNVHKHLTKNIFEMYANGAWSTLTDADYLWTYSSQNDILEVIAQYPDSTGAPKRNQYKEVNSNFLYFTRTLGTSESQKTELALSVYPNPATDIIQIQLAENKSQALTVSVKDITGKIWQSKSFKAEETKQLNIENLPKGIYLLQLQTKAGTVVKRIVKQ